MNELHHIVGAAVRKARDEAKEILALLESQGHPETGESSSLYLALVALQKRLLVDDPPPPPVANFVPELEQLVHDCTGKLAPVTPLIEEALRLAREAARK